MNNTFIELNNLYQEAVELFNSYEHDKMNKALYIFLDIFRKYPNESSAPYSIGYAFEKGFGVKQDLETAITYYKFSVDLGNEKAMFNLGRIYYDRNNIECIDLFKRAFDLGNKVAGVFLGSIFQYGKGFVEINLEKAKFYYEQLDDDISIKQLADIYRVQDNVKCISMYERVLAKGNNDVLGSLGSIYWEGRLTTVDITKAMDYFKKALREGNFTSVVEFIEIATSYRNTSAYTYEELAQMGTVCNKITNHVDTTADLKEATTLLEEKIRQHFNAIRLIFESLNILKTIVKHQKTKEKL